MNEEKEYKAWDRYWPWFTVVLIVLGAGYLRWHLLDVPLERDEGEYAYGGQLLLQGVPPYQLLYNMKFPGIYAVYAAVLAIFGQSHTGVHLGLLVVNAISTVLVFLLGRRVAGRLAGLGAAAIFAVWSVGQPVQGVYANAEHFVLVPALAGLLALWAGLDLKRPALILLSGVLLGIGVLIKQHGMFFAIWGGLYLVLDQWFAKERKVQSLRQLMLLASGTLLPYLITCLFLLKAGVFAQFWFWTIDYAKVYATQVPLAEAWLSLQERAWTIMAASPLLWLAAALGIIVCLFGRRLMREKSFILGFAIFSFLAVCPGLFFRPHYFILLLPASALLAGIFLESAAKTIGKRLGVHTVAILMLIFVALGIGTTLYRQRQFLFEFSPAQATNDTYWPNPFNESLEVASFIRLNSKPSDTIAIIGSEPQIFFYAGRRSATGFIYMYPLMEENEFALEMQKRLITEVERAQPEFLLFVRIPTSWLQRSASHTLIYEWFTGYKEKYERVGVVQIFEKSSDISWLSNAGWPPATPYWIEVMRKKGSGTEKDG